MTSPVPFLRPNLLQPKAPGSPLTITGDVPIGEPYEPYEARLQVNNVIGEFEVISVTGDTLPRGSDVYADNGTDELVITWPAYQEEASTIPNGDFSTGTLDHWTLNKKGELPGYPTNGTVSSSRPPLGYTYSAFWQGNKGTGHAKGVECIWWNDFQGKCKPGRKVTASAQIALDDTSSSQNRGEVRISFYDAGGNVLLERSGNVIRGNNSNYQKSEVVAYAPANTIRAHVSVWTTANASGGVRFGAVRWDLPEIIGTDEPGQYTITVTVRDSAGRIATRTLTIYVIASELKWYWVPRISSNNAPAPLAVSSAPSGQPVSNPGAQFHALLYVDNYVMVGSTNDFGQRRISYDGGKTITTYAAGDALHASDSTTVSADRRCIISRTSDGTYTNTFRLLDGTVSACPAGPATYIRALRFVGNRLIAVFSTYWGANTQTAGLYYSDDYGDSWNFIMSANSASYMDSWFSAENNGVTAFMFRGSGTSKIVWTEDGENWDSTSWSHIGSQSAGLAGGNGRWVMGEQGYIRTSVAKYPTDASFLSATAPFPYSNSGRNGLSVWGDTVVYFEPNGAPVQVSYNGCATWANSGTSLALGGVHPAVTAYPP